MQTTDSENRAHDAGTNAVQPSRHDTSKLTEWQAFFLTRLESLLDHQYELSQKSDISDEQRKMVSKAVYSTFLDCQAQGIGEMALQCLAQQGVQGPSTN